MSTAIVTGASRGLGKALAAALAEAGWDLVIDARDGTELAAASAELAGTGSAEIVAVEGDVTTPGHIDELMSAAAGLGHLRLVVNNAGALGPSPQPRLADYPLDVLEAVYRTNVVAPLRLVQRSLPELRRRRGMIINITSDAATAAYEGWGGYGSSKAALEQISHVLSEEESQVDVYWVDPGDMRTRMHADAFPGEDISDRPVPESRVPGLIRLIEGDYPSGRYIVTDLLAETRRPVVA